MLIVVERLIGKYQTQAWRPKHSKSLQHAGHGLVGPQGPSSAAPDLLVGQREFVTWSVVSQLSRRSHESRG